MRPTPRAVYSWLSSRARDECGSTSLRSRPRGACQSDATRAGWRLVRRIHSAFWRTLSRGVVAMSVTAVCAVVASSAAASTRLSWSAPLLIDRAVAHDQTHSGMRGLSCPSVTLCVAVDHLGRVLTSTTPSDDNGWTVTRLHAAPSLAGVSCPSVSLCVAFDLDGNLWSSTNPGGGATNWRSSRVVSRNGSFAAISCPSVSLCVGVNGNGDILSSTQPAGGSRAWLRAHVERPIFPGFGLTDVSCPSPSFCVAVDELGNVWSSTDPAGGSSAWHKRAGPSDRHLTLSCASVSLCVAVGDVVWSTTNPAGGRSAWRPGSDFLGTNFTQDGLVYCTLGLFCALGGLDGALATSDSAAGGEQTWSFTNVDGTNSLDSMSCPSASLCVATDDAGNIILGEPTAPRVRAPLVVVSGGSTPAYVKARRHGRSVQVDLGLAVACPPTGPACNVNGEATGFRPGATRLGRIGRIRTRIAPGRSRKITFALTHHAGQLLAILRGLDVAVGIVAKAGSGAAVANRSQFSLLPPGASCPAYPCIS